MVHIRKTLYKCSVLLNYTSDSNPSDMCFWFFNILYNIIFLGWMQRFLLDVILAIESKNNNSFH